MDQQHRKPATVGSDVETFTLYQVEWEVQEREAEGTLDFRCTECGDWVIIPGEASSSLHDQDPAEA